MDLQEEYKKENKKYSQLEAHKFSVAKDMRRAELTLLELSSLDKPCPLYRSVGKMFLRMNNNDLVADVSEEYKSLKVEVDSTTVKVYLF